MVKAVVPHVTVNETSAVAVTSCFQVVIEKDRKFNLINLLNDK